MIIPVRCFTCGKVLGNKFNYFTQKTIERKQKLKQDSERLSVITLSDNKLEKTIEGEILDEMGCIRMCCRTKILTHIPLINEL